MFQSNGHINCEDADCKVCLADAFRLEKYLFEKTRTDRKYHDLLSEYRVWVDAHNIPAETEFGWPTVETYEHENIEAFINDFNKE
jgi:hypothetical protein